MVTPTVQDFVILPLCAFLGYVGLGLTGFGMAIIYLFGWQVAVLSGYKSDLKYAIFIQALALLSAQPLLLYRSGIQRHAHTRTLRYFLPVTILTTPLGQLTGDRVSTTTIEVAGGILVTFMALLELYHKRHLVLLVCGGATEEEETEIVELNGEDVSLQGIGLDDTVEISSRSAVETHTKIAEEDEAVLNGGTGNSLEDQPQEAIKDERKTVAGNVADRTSAMENTDEMFDDCGPLSGWARTYTLTAGAASGFLGGLCGIRGPPVIFYFLYPPFPFSKRSQRATAVCMSATNAAMRVLYYLFDVLVRKRETFFAKSDWGLYVAVIGCSIWGCYVGSEVFEYVKGSSEIIRSVLAVLLLLCGVSLLISSFGGFPA